MRADPTVGFEHAARCGVDVEAPWTEQAHVSPVVDRRARRMTGLENHELDAALGQMRRCGQTYRTRTQDGYGLCPTRGSGRGSCDERTDLWCTHRVLLYR
jgi:hypothetical protein